MPRLFKRLISIAMRQSAKLLVAVALGGLFGGALARYSAGFGVDERELDSRLSEASIAAIRGERAHGTNFGQFYVQFLQGIARGDLGFSTTLNRPIKDLIRERMKLTGREILFSLGVASLGSLVLAGLIYASRARLVFQTADLASNISLCLPAALLGYFCILLKIEPFWALSICAFPYLFRYAANLIDVSATSNHVLAARARGIGGVRLLLAHLCLPNLAEILATLTLVVSISFGAAVPIEYATETPGLGQLAWQAASSRDLPVLCVITMIATGLVLGASGLAEMVRVACIREQATR